MFVLRFLLAMLIAYFAGELVKKIKFPAIIGWLIVAMFLGEHGLNLLSPELVSTKVYQSLMVLMQILVGSMVGYKLVYRDIKDSISKVFAMGISDLVVTFAVVTGAFALILHLLGLPIIAALLFGGIAIATAPAPPVSVVEQYDCSGPLSDSVPSMTAFNSVMVNIVFFPLVSVIGAVLNESSTSVLGSLLIMILAPILLGGVIGLIAGKLVGKNTSKQQSFLIYLFTMLVIYALDNYLNWQVFTETQMMSLLAGIAGSCAFMNVVDPEKVPSLQMDLGPIHSYALMIFIVNLSIHLNPAALFDGGMLMVAYILIRALGKYLGCYLGAKISHAPKVVEKYMGVIMMPHSGVSIMFAGIAAYNLMGVYPELANLLQITISAAALIIEIISLPLAGMVYRKLGEAGKEKEKLARQEDLLPS
ncbi:MULTISPECIES: cation:proton antiporter [Aerococcus]|uniref:cation:proton antiporter n=1 Tax=Aerococcus urinae (strain CCUG 59500 / ACS-120-V-Col10a) TaxID=2976812 RepID=UPI000200F0C5|nr:cation:proton antiporter [Aerococcus sp. Group 1]AEA00390.1 transporter, CPA2 family [Aerococcus sp. Group 1]MCY3054451.1 cation:proton antiporter [Aerococcus sp. Group 1]MCY3056181.1 cation:proton antiporter [Aerococcus sp. Group 1]MCY3061063.1 cation:proton antiporter [Aerococcus sp. Group 1]